jgi:CheY-like chemotaxis protein
MTMQKVVLHVEDDPDSVYLFKSAMERAGKDYLMQVASDGQMAVDYLKGTGKFQNRNEYPLPQLVLLDLKLPKVAGLDVLKWIRGEAGLHVPVVIMTSSQHPDDLSRAYKAGANGYLVKPANLEVLFEMATMIQKFWLTHNHLPFD